MSFILDALKKSEAERKRQDAPGIASIPPPTEDNSGSKWIWIIAVLLTVNVVVLTFFVLRPASDGPSETVAASPSTEAQSRAPDTAVAAAPARQPGETVSRPVEQPPVQATATNTAPAVTSEPPGATSQPAPDEPSGLPTLDELRSAGRLQLPELHVDIHVYSGQPADRFVFVNMTKYREKEKLSEGPVVTRITPDGVELDYLGTAFLLPRE